MPIAPFGFIRRMSPHRFLPPTLVLLGVLVVPGHGSEARERFGPAREAPDPTSSTEVVSTRFRAAPTRPTATPAPILLVRIPVPPTAPGERASVMIDAGIPTAAPTGAEQRKLEIARARIERARLAGTLYRLRPAFQEAEPLPFDWQARKHALMRAQAPRPFADDPDAGVGPRPSVQKTGPAGLTSAEEAKRRAQPSSAESTRNQEGR